MSEDEVVVVVVVRLRLIELLIYFFGFCKYGFI